MSLMLLELLEPAASTVMAAVDPQLAESMADLPWWEVFEDPVLHDLLKTGLEQNYDIEVAVARTEQARNQVIATRSAFFPQIDYRGSARRSRYPVNLLGNSQETFTSFLGLLSAAWEIDIWGRIRRANEAAKAELLASEDNQRAVLLSLVSQVASTYLQLLALDAKLQIAEEAVAAFQDTYDLFDRKYEGGVASKLEVTRAAAAEAQASASVPNLKIQIEATENRLSLLLGRPPAGSAWGWSWCFWPPRAPMGSPERSLAETESRFGRLKAHGKPPRLLLLRDA